VEKGLPLTAVTNDVNIAAVLAKSRSIKLQALGGTLRPGSYTLLGEPCINFLAGVHVDICLL
jgi:DeoR/GlpR family transcriptional regulator of sugar metabolism